MHIEQAKTLKAALDSAIAEAERIGASEVDLHGTLDQTLGQVLEEAQAALDKAQGKA